MVSVSTIIVGMACVLAALLLWELVLYPTIVGVYRLSEEEYKHSSSCNKPPRYKYYVCSRDLRVIMLAETPRFAALEAYSCLPNRLELDLYFYVDERGFRCEDASHKVSIDDVIKDYEEANYGEKT